MIILPDLLFHHSFHVHNQMNYISLQVFVIFSFILVCCCLFCLGILFSFLLICWYFLLFFPTSCMIAFCCSYLFCSMWCCLFYEFIVSSSSSCHLSFVVVLGNCFLFECALVFLIHPLVFLCFPNFGDDCILLQFFPLVVVVLSFLFILCSVLFMLFAFCCSFL